MKGCNIAEQGDLLNELYEVPTITALQLRENVLDNHFTGVLPTPGNHCLRTPP